jgi:hypothetical protein
MDCHHIKDKLSAYLDDQLSSDEKVQVENHLNACKICSCSLEELRKTILLTRGLEDLEPPPWLARKVMDRVREEAGQKKGILRKLFYPLHIKLPLEAVATIAIAVTAFYVFKTIQPEIGLEKSPPGKEHAAYEDRFAQAPAYKKDIVVREEVQEQSEVMETREYSFADMPEAPQSLDKEGLKKQKIVEGKTERSREPAVLAGEKRAPKPAYRALDMDVKGRTKGIAPEEETAFVQEKKEKMPFTISVDDAGEGIRKIEEAVKNLDGRVIDKRSVEKKHLIFITLNADKVMELREGLKLLGKLKEEEGHFDELRGIVDIEIEVLEVSGGFEG